jgi:hypothetical protein
MQGCVSNSTMRQRIVVDGRTLIGGKKTQRHMVAMVLSERIAKQRSQKDQIRMMDMLVGGNLIPLQAQVNHYRRTPHGTI